MSAYSPLLQFVTELPNSPKTEVKGVFLAKGPWYKTLGSPRLPFDLNPSLSFPSLFQLGGTCTPLGRLCFLHASNFWNFVCFDMPFFSENFVGRRRQGQFVSWVEKASLECIEGAQPRAPLICEELTGIRRQPLLLHSPRHPLPVADRVSLG